MTRLFLLFLTLWAVTGSKALVDVQELGQLAAHVLQSIDHEVPFSVVERDGWCWVALDLPSLPSQVTGHRLACKDEACCTVGKWLEPDQQEQLKELISSCVEQCSDPNHCVAVTANSPTGLLVQDVVLGLHPWHPYMVTFESLPTINCPLLSLERWYHFDAIKEDTQVGRFLRHGRVKEKPGIFGWPQTILFVSMTIIAAVGSCLGYQWYSDRRRGYESVPVY